MLTSQILAQETLTQDERDQLLAAAAQLPNAKEVNGYFFWSPQPGGGTKLDQTRASFRTKFGDDGGNYDFGDLIPHLKGWLPGSAEDRLWRAKCGSLPKWLQRALKRLVRKSLSNEDDQDLPNRKAMRIVVGWDEDPVDPERWNIVISYEGRHADAQDDRRHVKVMIYGKNLGA